MKQKETQWAKEKEELPKNLKHKDQLMRKLNIDELETLRDKNNYKTA